MVQATVPNPVPLGPDCSMLLQIARSHRYLELPLLLTLYCSSEVALIR